MKIKLLYKYLKADINQLTYRYGGKIADAERKNDAQADERTTDVEFYLREIESAVADLKVIGHPAIMAVNPSVEADDSISADTKYWGFAIDDSIVEKIEAKTLAQIMHRFVIYSSLRSWALSYASDAVELMYKMKDDALQELNDALYSLALPHKHRRSRIVSEDEITITDDITIGEE